MHGPPLRSGIAAGLHSPDGDRSAVDVLLAAEDLLFPRPALRAVEDHQVALAGGATVRVGGRLHEPLRDGALQAPVQHLALDHDPVGCVLPSSGASSRPDDEQVRTAPAEAVLALDTAAAVDDALQERLQQQLPTRLR